MVYGALRTVAVASPPRFLHYWPARRALCFEVSFGREETDEGLDVLVLLDAKTGQLLHLAAEKAFMNDCDCWPTLTPDGQTLLAGKELLRATGQVISLEHPGRVVAGTRVLNDTTFLVAYESDQVNEVVERNNTLLLNRQGKVMQHFTFHGTDRSQSSGGFSLAYTFLPATQTTYLFDNAALAFILLPSARPQALHRISIGQLQPFKLPRRSAEVELTFEPDDGASAKLYVDTLSLQVRGTIRQPS